MEIPKNTTQIGEVHGDYKIFIEDYVISYIKQLCRQEPDRKKRIAFYGVMRSESSQQYFFIYGGSEVKRHGRSDTYLSREDYEEITWAGGNYFEEYVPLGFATVEVEIPEGIYLFLAGKEIYVQGYHIFYEKNDSMLTFLIHRQDQMKKCREEALQKEALQKEALQKRPVQEKPWQEEPMQEEPLREKLRQEKLRQEKPIQETAGEIKLFGIVKSAAAALFIVLCVIAISTMNGLGKIEGLQNFFGQALRTMTEKKIPDKEADVRAVSGEPIVESDAQKTSVPDSLQQMQQENVQALQEEPTVAEPDTAAEPEEVTEPEPTVAEVKTHIIQKGETLISISKAYYGDESQVRTICELNGITNSDKIQVGQKIVLP